MSVSEPGRMAAPGGTAEEGKTQAARTLKQPNRQAQRLYWLLGASGVLTLFLAGVLWWVWPPELHGVMLQSPRPTADFTLASSTGEPVSLSDYRGKHVMIYFGYTYCPDVCPITMNDLAEMAGVLGPRAMEDVQVLFISVDPVRDTPEHLATYLPHFHPDFVGLTGTVQDIQPVASQFGIFFEAHGGEGDAGYLVDHSSAVTLVDPQGRMRIVFPYGVSGAEMAADLQYFMRRTLPF